MVAHGFRNLPEILLGVGPTSRGAHFFGADRRKALQAIQKLMLHMQYFIFKIV
jgi:hypothetical protein